MLNGLYPTIVILKFSVPTSHSSDHKGMNVCVKVLLAFCIGLALVTTVFGAMRGLAEANRKRVVKVRDKIII